MLKTVFFIILSSLSLFSNAQHPTWLSYTYLNIETSPAQMRFYKSKIVLPIEQKQTQWIPTLATWEWYGGIGTKLYQSFYTEVGYYQRTYLNGINNFNIPKCGNYLGANESQDHSVQHFYLRFYYNMIHKKQIKKSFNVFIGLGYAYAISPGPSSFIIRWGGQCPQDTSKYYYQLTDRSIDAIQPRYHLLEGSLKMEYQLFKYLGLTASINYNQAFKTIGIYKLDYGITDGSYKGYFESETKGTNFEFCFGLKLYPFATLEQMSKKKKTKIIQQGRFRD